VITQQMVSQLRKADVLDPEGDKIGTVGEVWLEEGSHEPVWVSVRTGMFGMKESFVPLQGAEAGSDALHVAVRKDQVKDAPRVDADGRLSSEEERALYAHYGFGPQGDRGQMDRTGRTTQPRGDSRTDSRAGAAGRPNTSKPDASERPDAPGRPNTDTELTRSEERLRVGTETVESGHVRLRKYVVTENQQVNVPVRHEELRIEREPIAEGTATAGDATFAEDERDITLHAERPVVQKEAVPVERIRVGTETVTEQQTVSGEVRKEQFDVDRGDGGRGRNQRRSNS
jgi:uncharacterized protein (TIGR02271 family)